MHTIRIYNDTITIDSLQKLKSKLRNVSSKEDIDRIIEILNKNEERSQDCVKIGDIYKDFPGSMVLNYLMALNLYKSLRDSLPTDIEKINNTYKKNGGRKDRLKKLEILYDKNNQIYSYLDKSFDKPDISSSMYDDLYDESDEYEFPPYIFSFEEFEKYDTQINNLIKDIEILNIYEKEVEKEKQSTESIISNFLHAIGNIIDPGFIYDVLKKMQMTDVKKDEIYAAMVRVYTMETSILLRRNLVQLKLEKGEIFIKKILDEKKDKTKQRKNVSQIISFAIERILAYTIFHYRDEDLLNQLMATHNQSRELLGKSFLDEIFFCKKPDVFDWMNKSYIPCKLQIADVWRNITFKDNGYLFTMVVDHLQELFHNAIKYREANSDYLMSIVFDERVIESEEYLQITFSNDRRSNETRKLSSGLGFINSDLRRLNENDTGDYLIIEETVDKFLVKLLYKKSIFV